MPGYFRAARTLDWTGLRKRWLRAVLALEAGQVVDLQAQTRTFLADLERRSFRLSESDKAQLVEFSSRHEQTLQHAIGIAPRMVAGALGADRKMSDRLVARVSAEVFKARHGDGLNVSDRIWRIPKLIGRGLNGIHRDRLRAGRAAGSVIYDMQATLEGLTGAKFVAVTREGLPKWLKGFREAGQAQIFNPDSRQDWAKALKKVEGYVNKRAEQGTHWAGKQLIKEVRRAVATGNDDLARKAAQWWAYDRQLYYFKRIYRTEAATALHVAQIQVTEDDPDIVGYEWRLSSSHPRVDICDEWARADHGLGAGVWPKDKVARGKAHPHCMCYLIPKVGGSIKDVLKAEEEGSGSAEGGRSTAPKALDPPRPVRPRFKAAKTSQAAAKWAEETGLSHKADYSGIAVAAANEMNKAIFETSQLFPELTAPIRFIGSAQARNRHWIAVNKPRVLELYGERWRRLGLDPEKEAEKVLRRQVGRIGSTTWAQSTRRPEDYGITFNTKFFNSRALNKTAVGMDLDVQSGFHPVGCATVKAVVDHELGHQLDYLLGLRKDRRILELVSDLTVEEVAQGLSRYAAENIGEFIAEAWSEYQNNPNPRGIARKVGEIIMEKAK